MSWCWNSFRITYPFWGESTSHCLCWRHRWHIMSKNGCARVNSAYYQYRWCPGPLHHQTHGSHDDSFIIWCFCLYHWWVWATVWHFEQFREIHLDILGPWRQKLASGACRNNYIPKLIVGCNYLIMLLTPVPDTKVVLYSHWSKSIHLRLKLCDVAPYGDMVSPDALLFLDIGR